MPGHWVSQLLSFLLFSLMLRVYATWQLYDAEQEKRLGEIKTWVVDKINLVYLLTWAHKRWIDHLSAQIRAWCSFSDFTGMKMFISETLWIFFLCKRGLLSLFIYQMILHHLLWQSSLSWIDSQSCWPLWFTVKRSSSVVDTDTANCDCCSRFMLFLQPRTCSPVSSLKTNSVGSVVICRNWLYSLKPQNRHLSMELFCSVNLVMLCILPKRGK